MDALVGAGADLSVDGPDGTPLRFAVGIDISPDIILALLEGGANARDMQDLSEGQFLLMRATKLGLARAVRALVEVGVDSSQVHPSTRIFLLKLWTKMTTQIRAVRALVLVGVDSSQVHPSTSILFKQICTKLLHKCLGT